MIESPDGISLFIGGSAVTAIATVLGAWIKARYGRSTTKIEPQPVQVEQTPQYVTCAQCAEHRQALGNRIDAVAPQLSALSKKLDEIDAKAETRSYNLHRRLDPLVGAIGAATHSIENHLADHRAKNA